MTKDELQAALGCTPEAAAKWCSPLANAAQAYGVTTPMRLAAWLAQVGHESGLLTITEENLRYSAEGLLRTFPKYFDATTAAACARQPERIANKVYGGRMGNGDEASGDGWRFRGRGLVQLTGRENYRNAGTALGLDLVGQPDLLMQPTAAAMSAGWFWDSRNLNPLADSGDFDKITRAINGGLNGKPERDRLYALALSALGAC